MTSQEKTALKRELAKEDYYKLAHRANTRIARLIEGGHQDTESWRIIESKLQAAGRRGMKSFPMGKNIPKTEQARLKSLVIDVLAMKGSKASVLKKWKKTAKENLGQYLDDEEQQRYFDMWRNADIRGYLERFTSETDTQEINRWEIVKQLSDDNLSIQEVLQAFKYAEEIAENDNQFKELMKKIVDNKLYDISYFDEPLY